MARSTTREGALIDELWRALDEVDESPAAVTSIRQPEALRRAMRAAVELGWAKNANEGAVDTLRQELVWFCRDKALEAHVREHPEARPRLAGVAVALAELRHDPLADEPDLIEQAAREIVQVRPDAEPEEVLGWAASLQHHRER
jgi:hypothetical protein